MFRKGKIIYQNHYIHINGLINLSNIFVGTGKLILGIINHSVLTCMQAFYTYGMIMSKLLLIQGILCAQNKEEELTYYHKAGYILILSSFSYMVYCMKLLFFPASTNYSMIEALIIATFTFTEIAINVYGILKEGKSKHILYQGMKWIGLASSCICLVLTQTAILSFKGVSMIESNGLLGILMGLLATIFGIFMVKKKEA